MCGCPDVLFMDGLVALVRVSRVRLSQLVSHALRHHPDRFFVELSEDGFTSLGSLAAGLTRYLGYPVSQAELVDVIRVEGGTRYTIVGDLVRAEYGHTQPVVIPREPVVPPEFLYHGTLEKYVPAIREQGLLRHNLHFVHLSASRGYAEEAGTRRGRNAMVVVDALKAHSEGLQFFQASEEIWLTEFVPAKFLKL